MATGLANPFSSTYWKDRHMRSTSLTDYREVTGDPAELAGQITAVFTGPLLRKRAARAAVALAEASIGIPPSDRPAGDLPDYEPTDSELMLLHSGIADEDLDDLLDSANTLAAYERHLRDLRGLRTQWPDLDLTSPEADEDQDELDTLLDEYLGRVA
ncbi:hypothetical protein D5S17_23480 [Pseudonocardiaceae bacterium YIM PH 21723]|nr:hypothetical protein D5S17_23480 [Pseudonocardiaceae bacterium YIM PH 21723]